MSRASVVVVRNVSVTCHGDDLATRHTCRYRPRVKSAITGSVSARPAAFLVAPNATSWEIASGKIACGGALEELLVFGVRPGQPPSMYWTPEQVQLLGHP